jgi:hypothetical protein
MVEPSQMDSMSVAERLQLMEQLWEALLRESPEPSSQNGTVKFWLGVKPGLRAAKQSF